MSRFWSSVLLINLMGLVASHGKNASELRRLLNDKMNNYNPELRPVMNLSDPVNIGLNVFIFAIQSFDEVFESLSISGCVAMAWKDEFLSWNSSDYGGVSEFHVKAETVWVPTIVNINSAKAMKGLTADWLPAYVSDGGIVIYAPPLDATVLCRVNVYYYPFDKQICRINLATWSYGSNHVKFKTFEDHVDLTHYELVGPWLIVNSSIELSSNDNVEIVVVSLELERRSAFVVINSICPIVALACLNILVFFIPTESGERILYSLTVLLAIAVFLTLVGDTLPKTAKPVSLFSIYLLVTLISCICTILSVILSLHFYFKSADLNGPPRILKSIYSCVCSFRRNDIGNKDRRNEFDTKEPNKTPDNILSFGKHVELSANDDYEQISVKSKQKNRNVVNGEIKTEERYNSKGRHCTYKFSTDPEQSGGNLDWKDFSKFLDMLFFVFFLLLQISVTLSFGVVMVYRL